MPGGERILVDGGGAYDDRVDVGALQVAPFLWHRRVLGMDRVILSHPHPDHMAGLAFILRAFRVRSLWDNGDRPVNAGYEAFRAAAGNKGLFPRTLNGGMGWRVGETLVEVLHPLPGEARSVGKNGSSRRNNASLVLRVSLGKVSFLLPGDIEAESEEQLAARGGLESTVLVAPHHGSRTSSTEAFLKAVSPRFAVFSASSSPRGLGHGDVVARYRALGARVFHTGEDGLVSFVTDGKDLTVETHLSRRRETLLSSDGNAVR
jgi:competence protein ComEC